MKRKLGYYVYECNDTAHQRPICESNRFETFPEALQAIVEYLKNPPINYRTDRPLISCYLYSYEPDGIYCGTYTAYGAKRMIEFLQK